jgi:hypothetical protein
MGYNFPGIYAFMTAQSLVDRGVAMEADPSHVIVGPGTICGGTQVHHEGFPELRVEGETTCEAAQHLINELTKILDSALTSWRRETVQHTIDDVQAFTQRRDT